MKDSKKFGIAMFLIATISLSSSFAQSNTNYATGRTIRTDQDNYLDVNYFDEVLFDKVFAHTDINNSGFQLGAATRFNDIYLGAHYEGNFWGNLSGYHNHTITDNKVLNTNIHTDNLDYGNEVTADMNIHNFTVLLGLQNMGFSLNGYINLGPSTIDKNKNSQTETGNGTSNNSSSVNNDPKYDSSFNDLYSFNLNWGGMTFNNKDTLIKPYATISFQYYNNATSRKWESDDDSQTIKGMSKDKTHTSSDLGFTTGSEFIWGKESSFMQVLNVSNDISFDISPSKVYESEQITSFKNGNASIQTDTTKTIDGRFSFKDNIYTGYRLEYKPNDTFTLGARASLSTTLSYSNPGSQSTKTSNVTTHQYWNPDTSSYLSNTEQEVKTFTSETYTGFGLGLSYAIKPNLKINLGYNGNLPSITVTDSTTEKTYKKATDAKDGSEKTRNVNIETEKWSNSIATGLVWDLNDYCTLDVYLDIGNQPSLNDLWTAGWQIGFVYKM